MSPHSRSALQGLARFTRQHRTALVATATALMAGFAITAVAVAPMVPDAADLPQRWVSATVVPEGMEDQLAALAAQPLALTRSDVTRGTDTADSLLTRLGAYDPTAAAFIRSDAVARQLLAGRGGKMVQAHTDADGRLRELVVRFPATSAATGQPTEGAQAARAGFNRLTVARDENGRWQSRLQTAPYGSQMRLASGTIRSSLYAATDESGLPDSVATQIAEVFATDIDFHRELRRGDTFSVVYESLTADGEPVAWNEGAGRVLAAEFVANGRVHTAVWFTGADGRGAYYDASGRSKRRSFLASPMEFSRVTSGFAMRMHPLLNTWRQHRGVDYGAPTGTAVRSVGDGIVDFAGWQNGYGNVVEIKHANNRSTLYAHLSRIGVRKGQRVELGQHIGAVGATGWATGPHLHFEFLVGGRHEDPLRIAKAAETLPLDTASRPRFAETVRSVQARLELAQTLASAGSRFE